MIAHKAVAFIRRREGGVLRGKFIAAFVIAKRQVVAMHMRACGNIFGRIADNLTIADHRRALGNGAQCKFMPFWNVGLRKRFKR